MGLLGSLFGGVEVEDEPDPWGRTLSEDLAEALAEDDAAEDVGMNSDERRTCWTCQSWADHGHDWLTGEITRDDAAGV